MIVHASETFVAIIVLQLALPKKTSWLPDLFQLDFRHSDAPDDSKRHMPLP
ncbi:hypothetical protein ACMAUO_15835 [Gluconacetobacter sp. Hr-1-5]|uniref:hypothetical protein n=1 Tax=Gluconacetobacter sp. Hr-1-5 TaxID=3395370 RepID=UPI003B519AA1